MADVAEQLGIALGPFENRHLFSRHFLEDVLPAWEEFQGFDRPQLMERLREIWERELPTLPLANEAQTEDRLIKPVLEALGFEFTVQAGLTTATGRTQPDYALFLSQSARRMGEHETGSARFSHAVGVAEAKRFDRPLDIRRATDARTEDPVAQIIEYVLFTRGWGMLTNGRLWRLYANQSDLIEGACYEVDLGALLAAGDVEAFRWFAAFFCADAFRPGADGASFLDRVLSESAENVVAVGDQLRRQVFTAVPLIAAGLLGDEPRSDERLRAAYDNSLVFLYRVLFCLHAEDRRLLPLGNQHYEALSVRAIRREVAAARDAGRIFPQGLAVLWERLRSLFQIVDRGDPGLGVSAYNGGLFAAAGHPYFSGRSVEDRLLVPALDALFRVDGDPVDYRALSPRHLGTIYEGLLEDRLVEVEAELALESSTRRHELGSYFTPEPIVRAIVERTLDPLLARRSQIAAQIQDPEAALDVFLELRILDPAMGSGHFLSTAVAYVALYVATDPSYAEGARSLPDIQRLVAERCIFGVDVNEMAVELARLALWLGTVRLDEPLVYLHNLRHGNSLVGAQLPVLLGADEDLFAAQLAEEAASILESTSAIETGESHDLDDVHKKQRLAAGLERHLAPLRDLADSAVHEQFGGDAGRLFHWELEFPEVFLTSDGDLLSDGGFHAVVGNPPYVRIQELGRELASYCRSRYGTASGSFDVYIPFIERSLELLAPGGRLGFIVPNKLLKLDYGSKLRELLAGRSLVEEVVDFGDAQLFAGATNYTCILVLDRGGRQSLTYRRVRGDAQAVTRELEQLDALPGEPFEAASLGAGPWVLVAGEEAGVLRAASEGAERLADVTQQIFQGLITSADPVYILEDRGMRAGKRVVRSRASERELELEPDFLHPLASGSDVERHAFRRLGNLLLFPYKRGEDGAMRLLSVPELQATPETWAYLREHEDRLRARERGKMDHDAWYAYVYPKSLGAHDQAKLGVAATVRRLEIAADPAGDVYFHNVRVNGILMRQGGPSTFGLLAILNSRVLDYVFRRGAAEHAGGHYAANKQFIAPLPIHVPQGADADRFEAWGKQLHDLANEARCERAGFLDWLADVVGARVSGLAGTTVLSAYERHTVAELLNVLGRSRARLRIDPGTRAFRDQLLPEHDASAERLAVLQRESAELDAQVDAAVYELYGLSTSQRRLVDAEYV